MSLKFVCFAILALIGWAASAQQDSVYSVPVEWQKVELQKQITEDLTKSIQAVVDPTKFLVHVVVTVSSPKTIAGGGNFNSKPGESFPLAKLGINKDSSAFKNAITEGQGSIFTRIAGIAVDVAFDSSVTRSQENASRTFVDNGIRAYSYAVPSVKFSRFAFFNSNDSAQQNKNMEVAKVNIEAARELAAGLSEAMTKGNDKLAEALDKGNDKLAQAILNMNEKREPGSTKGSLELTKDGDNSGMPRTWQAYLLAFKIPLAMLVAAILFIFFASGFKTIENKKVALMATAAAAQATAATEMASSRPATRDEEAEEVTVTGGGVVAGGGGGPGGSASDNGFDQFRKMAEQYAETAAFLLKTWVNMDTPESKEAIAAITKMIPVDLLLPVTQQLDENLKGRLKKASMAAIDGGSFERANAFIVDQMVDNFLVNILALPDELKVVLSGMSMDECIECLQKDSQFGAAFMNILPTAQVARMLSAVDESVFGGLFDDGVQFSADKIQFLAQNLGPALEEIRQRKNKTRVPLVDKSIELIKILGPVREPKILDMLVNSGDHEMLIEATQRYFPAELIMAMPADKMRLILNRLNAKQRARLIYSRSAGEQKTLLAAIGEKGRARDIIDSELSEIKNDKKAQAQIKKETNKIWEQFITSARQTIRSDESLYDHSKEMLASWLQKKGVDTSVGALNRAA